MPRLHIFLCALAVLVCQPISSAAQVSRFSTTAGPEPMGHLIDPDFGSQREFFRLDSKTWVERFSDGFIKVFNVADNRQLPSSVVNPQSNSDSSVSGTIITSTNSDLQYFVPNEIQPNWHLAYRVGNTGQFLTSSLIHSLLGDEPSRFYVPVGGPMAKIRDALFAAVPQTIDEHGQPDEDKMRYRFDGMTDPDHRKLFVGNGRIYLRQVFQGDWETKQFLGGCHLRPLYILAEVSFVPTISQSGTKWFFSATDAQANFSLMQGSDTKCSFAGFDVTGRVRDQLNNQNLKNRAIEAVRRAEIELPVSDIWSASQGPFARIFNNQRVCLYPHPQAFWVGNLRADENVIMAEVALLASPQVVFSTTCADAEKTSIQSFDGSKPGQSPHVTIDLAFPYTTIRDSILRSDSVRSAGIEDVQIEPHQAYMTLKLRVQGGTQSVNAIPIVQIPAEEGDISATLIFADIPDAPAGSSVSALNGSYTTNLKDQIREAKNALRGTFQSGKFTLTVPEPTMNGVTIVCEKDGMHAYVDVSTAAFGRWTP